MVDHKENVRPSISRFLANWAAAAAGGTIFGIAVPVLAILALRGSLSRASPLIINLMAAALLGASFGLTQYLVLRHILPRPHRWLWTTLASFIVGALLGQYVFRTNVFSTFQERLPAVLLSAAILGTSQFTVIRKDFARAPFWIPITVSSWVAAAIAADSLRRFDLPAFLFLGAGLPGIGLAWLIAFPEAPIYGGLTTRWSRPGQPGS